MKVESSALAMRATTRRVERVEVRETLRAWSGPQPASREVATPRDGQSPSDAVSIRLSEAAERLARGDVAVGSKERASEIDAALDAADNDPELLLLRKLVEWLTGRPVRSLERVRMTAQSPSDAGAAPAGAGPSNGADGRADAGFGLQYDLHAERLEMEQSSVAARGVLRTADGREIAFELNVTQARSHRETLDLSVRAGNAVLKDPLVLNFAAPAARLESTRFAFDLDGDGRDEQVPLLGAGSGYLALDLDGNGVIDSGLELFGPKTQDGFAELAAYDEDGNGFIDEGDAVFSQLRVWRPAAEGHGQLQSLAEHNVGAIALAHVTSPFSLRAADNSTLGAVRSTGVYLTEDGQAKSIQQIDLEV